MRKEIKHKLQYREEGEQKEIGIKIDFISNRNLKTFTDSNLKASNAAAAWNRMSILVELLAIEKADKADGYKDAIKKYESEWKDLNESLLEFNKNNFFGDRIELVKKILVDNGYKENKLLMNDDFWDINVDPSDFADFLQSAVYKDIDNKKKALAK